MTSLFLSKWLWLCLAILDLVLIQNSFALQCEMCAKFLPKCIPAECPEAVLGSDPICYSVWDADTSSKIMKNCAGKDLTKLTGGVGECKKLQGKEFMEELQQHAPGTGEFQSQLQSIQSQLGSGGGELSPEQKEALDEFLKKIQDLASEAELGEGRSGKGRADYLEMMSGIEASKMYEVCSCNNKDLCNEGETKPKSGGISGFDGGNRAIVIFATVASIFAHGF